MAATGQTSAQPMLIAAIDIGTTFSGWAYQFKHDYVKEPTKVRAKNWNAGCNISSKAPTTVLIRPDGHTLHAFGYEAEDKFMDLVSDGEHAQWYYFRHFKMKLFKAKTFDHSMQLKADNGQTLPAMRVFSLVIGYLKDNLMEECGKQLVGDFFDSDVRWVLTVPAIWNDGAKQFMRDAANMAGITDDLLMIALEPEAASVFCKTLALNPRFDEDGTTVEKFEPGTKYLILDAGGGTIDINAQEVLDDNNLRELCRPTGSNWGGTKVNEAFEEFLKEMFGHAVLEKFQMDNPDDYLSLLRDFEVKKRGLFHKNDSSSRFSIPIALINLYKTENKTDVSKVMTKPTFAEKVSFRGGNKLSVNSCTMRSFFNESVEHILEQLESLLSDTQLEGCTTILMVGGYADSGVLQEAVKQKFPHMNVVTSHESSLIVLKGAVMYGRNPQVIRSRISKYTYGFQVQQKYDPKRHSRHRMSLNEDGLEIAKCVFRKVLEVGQSVPVGSMFVGHACSPRKGNTHLSVKLYASTHRDPQYVDEGCFKVGRFWVDCRDHDGHVTGVTPVLVYGRTELQVYAVHKTTGEETVAKFCLPD